MSAAQSKVYVSREQLADKIKCSKKTIQNYQRRGMPVVIQSGNLVRYDLDEAMEWIRINLGARKRPSKPE